MTETSDFVEFQPAETVVRDLAIAATEPVELADGLYGRLVPEGFEFEVLDLVDEGIGDPRFKVGHATVTDVDSFVAYVRDQDEVPRIWADVTRSQVTAVFDDHRSVTAGRQDFKATYQLTKSPEFKQLMEVDGNFRGASSFAELVEDLQHVIASPSTADILELVRKFRSTTIVNLTEHHDDKTGDRTFRYETKTEIAEELIAPDEFVFVVPVYRGQEPVEVRAKFRYRPTGEAVGFGLKMLAITQIHEQAFETVVEELTERLPDSGHVIRGSWA